MADDNRKSEARRLINFAEALRGLRESGVALMKPPTVVDDALSHEHEIADGRFAIFTRTRMSHVETVARS